MNDPDILKTNDEIARKFGEIEADLAGCREIGELFERLLTGSEGAFGDPLRLALRPSQAGDGGADPAPREIRYPAGSDQHHRPGAVSRNPPGCRAPASGKRGSPILLPPDAAQCEILPPLPGRRPPHLPRRSDRQPEPRGRLSGSLPARHGDLPAIESGPERLQSPLPASASDRGCHARTANLTGVIPFRPSHPACAVSTQESVKWISKSQFRIPRGIAHPQPELLDSGKSRQSLFGLDNLFLIRCIHGRNRFGNWISLRNFTLLQLSIREGENTTWPR